MCDTRELSKQPQEKEGSHKVPKIEHQVVNVASANVGCKRTGQGVFTGVPLCILVTPNSLLLQLHEKKT